VGAVLEIKKVSKKVLWKLKTVMADRDIKNKALAEELDMHPVSISNLKNNKLLPEIGGEALGRLCEAIAKLSLKECTPNDLIKYSDE